MYSKAKVLGHPIHPMLVGFPVAFYTGTLVAFIVYAATMDLFWFRLACVVNWAGVGTAALAAVPGLIDWATGIPRSSPAKRTALIHMALNVTSLIVFLISAIVASDHWYMLLPPAGTGIALSALGVLLTVPAGFLGWSLVQDHHVGIQLSNEQERLEPVHTEATRAPVPREAR
ncbi:MAG TPA: DUF2231 domain-containing protein [Polyangiaceae bacterium]|nr:DUF2231 domain-containing protein [Polyangiaceae bacterium]